MLKPLSVAAAQTADPPMSQPAPLRLDEAETDLLLYLEERLVEHAGKVRSDLMRPEEVALVQRWHEAGFLQFRPIRVDEVDYSQSNPATHRVRFSEAAWTLAFQARRARAG